MEAKTVYFENMGESNTETTLKLAKQRAIESGIKTIIIASSRGVTAVKAIKALKGFHVIIVSHVTGFGGPDTQEFTEDNRKAVEKQGFTILTAAHPFAGLSRAMRSKHNMFMLGDIVSDTLRVFGHGTKVACELALMAADAGLVRTDEDVICIGGTGRGADTACVIKPVNTHNFFDLKVKEIICKPWVG
ncbi:MAG: hypothetical protein JW967_08660 [Dehalococcoidales bacterium]|nr:hypothetical protein [Dehalococcoidales bacterium]